MLTAAFPLVRQIWSHEASCAHQFSPGEYEPEYAAVADQPAIPTFPEHAPKRWNVLLDALMIGDSVIFPNTTVADAPSNMAVILLDSGTSYSFVVDPLCYLLLVLMPRVQIRTHLGRRPDLRWNRGREV